LKYTFGIDIALRKSGFILLDESGKIVYHEVFVVPAKVEYTEAVLKIYEKLSEVYSFILNKFKPEHLTTVMEDVAGFVHIKAALAIHAARTSGVLAYHHSHISNKNIVYHTPNAVKHWLTKKRGAKKDELLVALTSVFPEYNYSLLQEDEIDALALALYHMKGVQKDDDKVVPRAKRGRVSRRT